MLSRADVQRVGRSWLHTPFKDKGRVKGMGVDCVGIPLMIAEELGIRDKDGRPLLGRDYADYSAQPLGRFVQDICQQRLIRRPIMDMQVGDVVTMKMPGAPCHVGIITDMDGRFGLLHAYSGVGNCVEHTLDYRWKQRIVACFSFPGLED